MAVSEYVPWRPQIANSASIVLVLQLNTALFIVCVSNKSSCSPSQLKSSLDAQFASVSFAENFISFVLLSKDIKPGVAGSGNVVLGRAEGR
jgi:hypothetical protein